MSATTPGLVSLVDPRHTMVLAVDIQPFFIDSSLEPPLGDVLPAIRHFLDAATQFGVPRTFIRIVIPESAWSPVMQAQHEVALQQGLDPDAASSAFAPGFEPEEGDLVIVKSRYSAFVGTPLADLLRERGIQTVVALGLTTDICVSSTVRDAFQHEFYTVTLSDCTAEETLARHEAGLASLASCFGSVHTSSEVIAAWQTHSQSLAAD